MTNIARTDENDYVEDQWGNKCWYRMGVLHRDNAPAVQWANGGDSWYHKGRLHRADGPAINRAGCTSWFVHGREVSAEECSILSFVTVV